MRYRIGYSSKKENASVYIECTVRKPDAKYPVREIVRRLGKKKALLEQDPNALEKLQKEVDKMNENCKGKKFISPTTNLEKVRQDLAAALEQQSLGKDGIFDCRSAGFLILRKLYEELRFDAKFDYIAKRSAFKYDFAKIVKDLVLLRILEPASKLRSSKVGPERFLGVTSDDVNEIYKALNVLCENKKGIVQYWNHRINKLVPERERSVCLYDITTYAFESTNQDDLRAFGFSKDKKFNEVQVVMALATDKQGLPLNYGLYKGNQPEAATMVPFVAELQKKFGVKKLIVVADKGLNNKANIDALVKLGHDYVLSSKVRGASEDIKAQIFDFKSRILFTKANEDGVVIDLGWYKEICLNSDICYQYPAYDFEELNEEKLAKLKKQLSHQTTKSGKSVKSSLKRRYIITWSESRARKDKKDRERLVQKAKRLIEEPSKIKAEFKRGARSFVDVDWDPETAMLDEHLIKEQAKFDGIHVVETSLDAPAAEVLEIYGNLWRIENSFRHMKSTLESRPVFVRLPDHVRGHFLICFLALCICRYLEYKLDKANRHASVDEITDGLSGASVALINPAKDVEIYGTQGFTPTVKAIMEVLGLTAPDVYEDGPSLRKKLKLYCAVRNLFSTT